MTSREAAQFVFGLEAVENYERVKSFYTHYGTALERVFAERVDGRRGPQGGADVITPLGEFEFCSQGNTKNAAGEAAQRASGRTVVQVAGKPRTGRISAVDFLRQHGVKNAERVAGECEVLAAWHAKQKAEEATP